MRIDNYAWKLPPFRLLPVAALLLCTSCRSPQSTAAHSVAATVPFMEPAPPNAVDRLLSLHPEIKNEWLEYRTKEGDSHRSDKFADIAFQLDQTCFGNSFILGIIPVMSRTNPADRATEIEVLSFLGLPNGGARDAKQAFYFYYYWRTDTKSRWVAMVEIKDGLLESIGWNDATVNDFSKYYQYKRWSDVLGAAH